MLIRRHNMDSVSLSENGAKGAAAKAKGARGGKGTGKGTACCEPLAISAKVADRPISLAKSPISGRSFQPGTLSPAPAVLPLIPLLPCPPQQNPSLTNFQPPLASHAFCPKIPKVSVQSATFALPPFAHATATASPFPGITQCGIGPSATCRRPNLATVHALPDHDQRVWRENKESLGSASWMQRQIANSCLTWIQSHQGALFEFSL